VTSVKATSTGRQTRWSKETKARKRTWEAHHHVCVGDWSDGRSLAGKWATFPDWELIETRQVTEDFGFVDAAIRAGQESW